MNFNAYGYSILVTQRPVTLGFCGAPFDISTNCYHLGRGYRIYSPILMRFTSPDRISPFGRGGLNAYAYCFGDPVNRVDPEGTVGTHVKSTLRNSTSRNGDYAIRHLKGTPINLLPTDIYKQTGLSILRQLDGAKEAARAFKNVISHLSPNDLLNSFPSEEHQQNTDLLRWVMRTSKAATVQHHDNIMKGNPHDYKNDGRLSSSQVIRLEQLENNISTLRSNKNDDLAEMRLRISIQRNEATRRELLNPSTPYDLRLVP